ncbi:MAG: S41 family peptidase [Candidatus Izemoplasmataceae bacterium]
MKKILALVLLITLSFTLLACNQDPVDEGPTDLEVLQEIYDEFSIPTEFDLDTELPSLSDEASVSWVSSDESVVSNTGEINFPRSYEGDKTVTLTATLSYNDETLTKEFDVTVPALELVTETRNIPFENLATEYIVEDGALDVYYLRNEEVPYVDVQSFINLLVGAIVVDELEVTVDGNVLTIILAGVYEDEENPENDEEYHYQIDLNYNDNTVTVNQFGFFSALSEETQTDFGSDLYTIDYVYNETDPVTFNFEDYDFELVREYDNYLIPFHLANLFFTGSMFDVYYNHDKLYGVDTYQIYTGDNSSVVETLQESSKESDDIPAEVKTMTYNYLAFTFNHFFGIKAASEVEDYYTFLEPYEEDLLGTNKEHYERLGRITVKLDDLHTSYLMDGFYSRSGIVANYGTDGPRARAFQSAVNVLYYETCSLPMGNVEYFENDTIAVVSLSGFDTTTPGAFKDALDEVAEKGTVEAVVVDLSCNTGGIIGTMLQTIGYMTDEPIAYHSLNAGDGSSSSSYIGTNNDAYDFDWYVLTSPITYSAGNLMTSIVKDMGVATIIGGQASGGASSITTNLLPSGAIIVMSSPTVLANESYESIEFGVPVDIEITSNADIGDFDYVASLVKADRD